MFFWKRGKYEVTATSAFLTTALNDALRAIFPEEGVVLKHCTVTNADSVPSPDPKVRVVSLQVEGVARHQDPARGESLRRFGNTFRTEILVFEDKKEGLFSVVAGKAFYLHLKVMSYKFWWTGRLVQTETICEPVPPEHLPW